MTTITDRIAKAQDAFEAGFLSMAAKKRALDQLNRAYHAIQNAVSDAVRAHAFAEIPGTDEGDYAARSKIFRANDLPFDLHQVRDRHIAIIAKWTDYAQIVRDLIALRAAIKDAEIAPAPAKPEAEQRAEQVRKSVIDEMERRKAQFVEGLDIARHFGGLPVSVNAHWVHGHKGAVFLRHFFYLRGKLTPLNTIVAIAEAYEREQAQG